MNEESTIEFTAVPSAQTVRPEPAFALALVWSAQEPNRVGEVAFVEGASSIGRFTASFDYGNAPIAHFGPHGATTEPLELGRRVSRLQASLSRYDKGFKIESVGRLTMWVNGQQVKAARASVGSVIRFGHEIVLLVVQTLRNMPRGRNYRGHLFGRADRHGLVGESLAMWRLRERVVAIAELTGHVLVHGESGTGKELIARALHTESRRARGPYLIRNCAAFSKELATSELFGHVKGAFTGAHTPRQGIFELAGGGTAVLDEFGVLGDRDQARCLRLLENGVIEKVGATRPIPVDVRVVASTNSALSSLRHDILARLVLRIEVPSLDERTEDIPLLAQYLLMIERKKTSPIERFFDEAAQAFRLEPTLVEWLIRQSYGGTEGNIRRLNSLLQVALTTSQAIELKGELVWVLQLTPEVEAMDNTKPAAARPLAEITREEIEACMARHNGVQRRVAEELGVSVHALGRLIRKWRTA